MMSDTTSEAPPSLGQRLSEIRDAAGLSLTQASILSGIPKSVLWSLEVGRCWNPTRDTMLKLIRLYGVDPSVFFEHENPRS